MTSIHDINVTLTDGTETTMRDWEGKLLLIVNVASKCGLTPQYEGLQKLHAEYQDRGFSVIGVPCNQFNEQEPGTDAQVCAFAQNQYNVTFPLLSKTEVNGAGAHPLYKVLKQATGGDDIEWNFEKFLVDTVGNTITRFGPRVDPLAADVVAAIEENLPR
ncbi:glutathione peroxidase [Corynebacterium suranareeae]|uniref:Glutathione peroxidase n=1 Tax=Corynebacterium suranareeae TaxID=2506452 RepID=A0A160PT41_9CORY|nr:glutathione peroxidase [Corynebacterium suranareeae]BAU96936.1 glutathione peroxidase [Corynebacterium suranareeae]